MTFIHNGKTVNTISKRDHNVDKLAEALGLPENEEILMLLDLGYAAEGAGPLPNHTSRKPLSETTVFI